MPKLPEFLEKRIKEKSIKDAMSVSMQKGYSMVIEKPFDDYWMPRVFIYLYTPEKKFYQLWYETKWGDGDGWGDNSKWWYGEISEDNEHVNVIGGEKNISQAIVNCTRHSKR